MAVRSALRGRRSHEGETPGDASEGVVYDAFISYSHAVDGRLAPALQSALQRFSKPWYRLRALRSSAKREPLGKPGLWTSIAHALGTFPLVHPSRITGLGPVAVGRPARSRPGWIAQGPSDSCSRSPTASCPGTMRRGRSAPALDAALPGALHAAFEEEPRFIDLRWARTSEHLSLSDPRFRDAVADLASPIHERPKDDLIGEEVQPAPARRPAGAGAVATASSSCSCAAAAAAVLAVSQRNEARAQGGRRCSETVPRRKRGSRPPGSSPPRPRTPRRAVRPRAPPRRRGAADGAHDRSAERPDVHPRVQSPTGRVRRPARAAAGAAARDSSRPRRQCSRCGEGHEVALWDTTTYELVRQLSPEGALPAPSPPPWPSPTTGRSPRPRGGTAPRRSGRRPRGRSATRSSALTR